MATLATFFRRSDFMAADSTAMETPAPNRLRSLPADNIYFYSKRIDNSRLVREADPKMRTDCWSTIATACILAGLIGAAVSPRIGGILSGYQMEKLKAEQRELSDRRRMLQIEEAQMVSPGRLDELANRQKLSAPTPGQETNLQPKDSPSMALNIVHVANSAQE
jgi:hypothetical protein